MQFEFWGLRVIDGPQKEIQVDLESQHGGVGQGWSVLVDRWAPYGWETSPVPTSIRCFETPLLGLRGTPTFLFSGSFFLLYFNLI